MRLRSDVQMPDIVTITPNPSVDVSTTVDRIVPIHKIRGVSQRRDPGGGGINVARVAKRLNGDASAIYPVGGAIGMLLRRLLDDEGIESKAFAIEGETARIFLSVRPVPVNRIGSYCRALASSERMAELSLPTRGIPATAPVRSN